MNEAYELGWANFHDYDEEPDNPFEEGTKEYEDYQRGYGDAWEYDKNHR
jgi:hypothetical protein